MAKNVGNIAHKKSSMVSTDSEGKVLGPKLPEASALIEGEIAVNYAKGYETLSIKNSSGDIATFSCDATIQNTINSSVDSKITDAIEVLIGDGTDEIPQNIKLYVDTATTISDEIYTKEQIDEKISAATDVYVGDTEPAEGSPYQIYISTEESPMVEVYSKNQTDDRVSQALSEAKSYTDNKIISTIGSNIVVQQIGGDITDAPFTGKTGSGVDIKIYYNTGSTNATVTLSDSSYVGSGSGNINFTVNAGGSAEARFVRDSNTGKVFVHVIG